MLWVSLVWTFNFYLNLAHHTVIGLSWLWGFLEDGTKLEIPFEITQPLTTNVKNSNLLTIWSCSSHWQIVASRRIRKNIHLSFIFFTIFFCPWWGLNFDPKRNDPSPAAAIHKLEKNVVRFTLFISFLFLIHFFWESHLQNCLFC